MGPHKNYAVHMKYVIVVAVNMVIQIPKTILKNGKTMGVLGLIKKQNQTIGH